MLYLSKLSMDLRNPSVRQALYNAQDMHRNIMSAFDFQGQSPRQQLEILYRLIDKDNQCFLYIQSAEEPNRQMIDKNGYKLLKCKEISKIEEAFTPGKIFVFDLLAYPTKKKREEGHKNSKRQYIITPEDREDWLRRKAEQSGFEIYSYYEHSELKTYAGKQDDKLYLNGVQFKGILKVVEPEKFTACYRKGIGAGRAYGFGMLLLSGA